MLLEWCYKIQMCGPIQMSKYNVDRTNISIILIKFYNYYCNGLFKVLKYTMHNIQACFQIWSREIQSREYKIPLKLCIPTFRVCWKTKVPRLPVCLCRSHSGTVHHSTQVQSEASRGSSGNSWLWTRNYAKRWNMDYTGEKEIIHSNTWVVQRLFHKSFVNEEKIFSLYIVYV